MIVADFHVTLRRALAVKLWLARRLPRGGQVNPSLVTDYQDEHGAPCDASFLAAHLHPPGGRVLSLVWEELALRHGRTRAEIVASVFGQA